MPHVPSLTNIHFKSKEFKKKRCKQARDQSPTITNRKTEKGGGEKKQGIDRGIRGGGRVVGGGQGKQNQSETKTGRTNRETVHKFIVYDADFSFSASVEAGDSDI